MAMERFGIGEEHSPEVGRGGGTLAQQCCAALLGDVGEAGGDVNSAAEHNNLDAGADRGLRRTGIAAAIQHGGELGVRCGGPARVDKSTPPPRTNRQAGFGRAEQDNRKMGLGGRP